MPTDISFSSEAGWIDLKEGLEESHESIFTWHRTVGGSAVAWRTSK